MQEQARAFLTSTSAGQFLLATRHLLGCHRLLLGQEVLVPRAIRLPWKGHRCDIQPLLLLTGQACCIALPTAPAATSRPSISECHNLLQGMHLKPTQYSNVARQDSGAEDTLLMIMVFVFAPQSFQQAKPSGSLPLLLSSLAESSLAPHHQCAARLGLWSIGTHFLGLHLWGLAPWLHRLRMHLSLEMGPMTKVLHCRHELRLCGT